MRSLPLVCLVACLAVPFASSPARAVDDFDPANPPAGFWNNNGQPLLVPKLDAQGKLQVQATLVALVNTNLIDGHCKDKTGTKHPHLHVKDQYDNFDDADRFWDKRFGASDNPAKTRRMASANTEFNCYVLALNHFGNGTYRYWIDQNLNAADNAMNADSEGKDKATVQTKDALYYKSKNHATVVVATKADASGTGNVPSHLRFKSSVSGNYDYEHDGWDTPMYLGPLGQPGNPPPAWVWTPDALGNAGALDPAGKVRRKKP